MGARSDNRMAPSTTKGRLAGYSFELQELWFALARHPWTSLALVPAHEGGSALALCKSLASLGGVFRGAPLRVLEGIDLDLETAASLALSLQAATSSWSSVGPQQIRQGQQVDARTLVALGPLLTNPLGIPVCLACDGVLLVVESGVTTHAAARRTVELIGRDRVVGSVLYARG